MAAVILIGHITLNREEVWQRMDEQHALQHSSASQGKVRSVKMTGLKKLYDTTDGNKEAVKRWGKYWTSRTTLLTIFFLYARPRKPSKCCLLQTLLRSLGCIGDFFFLFLTVRDLVGWLRCLRVAGDCAAVLWREGDRGCCGLVFVRCCPFDYLNTPGIRCGHKPIWYVCTTTCCPRWWQHWSETMDSVKMISPALMALLIVVKLDACCLTLTWTYTISQACCAYCYPAFLAFPVWWKWCSPG